MLGWFGLIVRLESISPLVNNDYLIGEFKEVTILNQTTLMMILNNLIPILIFGSWTYGIYLLGRLLKMYEGNHFVSANVKT